MSQASGVQIVYTTLSLDNDACPVNVGIMHDNSNTDPASNDPFPTMLNSPTTRHKVINQ